MHLAEAYNLFMHGLNPQLRQLAGTMVTSGNLEEVIEIEKKATVYGEDKSGSSQQKNENKQKRQNGGKGGGKGSKGRAIGGLVVDQRERSKLFQEIPSRRSLLV